MVQALTAPPRTRTLVLVALAGAVVAMSLGVYGRTHEPTYRQVWHPGFSSTLSFKAWFATGVLVLGCAQVVTAMAMYGRLPLRGRWVARTHRMTGRSAFVISLPVAYSCLWSLGFQSATTRTAVHSVLGCVFYGVFTTKVLALHTRRVPGWALPLLGGTLFAVLVGLWWTSALWFFRNSS
jgi:hypothetical protein